MTDFKFTIEPSTDGQLGALEKLGMLEGFVVEKKRDGYHHVTVKAASFDEAQILLRDTLSDLEPPETTVGVLLIPREPQGDGSEDPGCQRLD
jgi:hypothetical protein